MPVFHYFGDDTFGRREAYNDLRASHDADGALAANTITLDGPRTSLGEIHAAAMTVPFLAAYRLVRVDGLCTAFNPARGGARSRRRRTLGDWDDLPARLAELPPTTLLVFLDGELTPANAMRRLIAEAADVREFRPRKGRDLAAWLHGRAQQLGLNLTPKAERRLIDQVGVDMGALASELEKLQLYAGDTTVDDRVIEFLAPRNTDAEIWDLTDAVGTGRPGPALRALETLRGQGYETFRVLGALANQMRRIIVAREILASGGDVDTIRSQLHINHPFPARKLADQAQRFPPGQAEAALRRVRDTDAAIQRFRRGLPGGLNDNLALELLVVDLAGAGAPAAAR